MVKPRKKGCFLWETSGSYEHEYCGLLRHLLVTKALDTECLDSTMVHGRLGTHRVLSRGSFQIETSVVVQWWLNLMSYNISDQANSTSEIV